MSAAEEVSDQAPETIPAKDVLEELIFKQDLNEVHLLIDFVSGRADRSLSTLSMRDPGDPAKTMTSGEIIKAIAEMRYPPKGTDAVNARNAAILLVAKDQLSALATPATGLTIAYTRLFIGEEAGVPWSGLRRRAAPGQNRERDHDIRINLAQRSFPGLQAHASKFRRWRDWLALLSLFWLALTALAYWDAGLGRTALERLDLDWKLVVEELNNNPALIRCEVGRTESAERAEDVQSDDNALRGQFACRKYNYLRVVAQTAGQEVNDVFQCGNMGLARLPHVWCWNWLLSGNAVNRDTYDNNSESAPGDARQVQAPALATAETAGQALGQAPAGIGIQVSQYAKANVAYWQTATAILSVFTAYILPIMFALLGTLIGAFRAILNRIGANELSPRDLVRMQIGIPTGLVAGIAVGLFLGPSSVPVQGAGGLSGQLTLTASGLGFLAGYASQSFFGFLDNMIRNIFPSGSTANGLNASSQGPSLRG